MKKPMFTLDELLLATYEAHKDAIDDMLPADYAELLCSAMKETVKQYIEDEGLEAAFPDLEPNDKA